MQEILRTGLEPEPPWAAGEPERWVMPEAQPSEWLRRAWWLRPLAELRRPAREARARRRAA